MRSFLDTNILVYAVDAKDPQKQERAQRLVEREVLNGRAVVSTQVLQEYFVTVTRKLAVPVDVRAALDDIHDFLSWPTILVDGPMILAAIARTTQQDFSFWDALIVEAALAGGSSVLYTEDMQHGRELGALRIVNPFVDLG